MKETTLHKTNTEESNDSSEHRLELDKLIERIQNARKAIKEYTQKDSKLNEDTLNYLKSINSQLEYFKRDLSDYLNQNNTKQSKLFN